MTRAIRTVAYRMPYGKAGDLQKQARQIHSRVGTDISNPVMEQEKTDLSSLL